MRPAATSRLLCVLVVAAGCGLVTACSAPAPGPPESATVPARSPASSAATGEHLPATARMIDLPPQTRTYAGPGHLVATGDAIWAAAGVFRMAPDGSGPTLTLSAPAADGMDADSGSVWVSDFQDDLVRRFDARSGALLASVQLPQGSAPEGVVVSAGAVWVAEHHGGRVDRIDPSANRVVASVTLLESKFNGPQQLAAGLGSIWVGVTNAGGTVYRIDPATNSVSAKIPFDSTGASPCGGIAVGRTAVWVADCWGSNHVTRIDPGTNTVAKVVDTGGSVADIATDGDSAWFVAGGDPDSPANQPGVLMQLRADDSIAHRYALRPNFTTGGAVVAFGALWVSSYDTPVLLRLPLSG